MTRNKGKLHTVIVLLAAVLCMTAFSTVAYAGGGDYYDSELPPESTATEETEPAASEPSPAVEPGTPFTEDGIALTRDLLFDKATNKQFITVETRSGHTLYIIIDYDKPADEDGEQYHTYFLNPVDEADLLALLEDEGGNSPITCSCTEKCSAGKVNTACPICSTNMSECAGKEAAPADLEPTEPTEEPKNSNVGGILAIVLIVALGGGAAVWYFKLRKPKADTKGSTELDEFDFDEDDEEETDNYGDYGADGNVPLQTDEQEDNE